MDSKIPYSAIYAAFEGDDEIGENCDPNNDDKSQAGVVEDVYKKILQYEELFYGRFITLSKDGEEAGFVYCLPELLVSFGVGKKHRTKEFLPTVFEMIKATAGESFDAYMWERNKRAIEWLKRCGMEQEELDMINVVKLKYRPCH